MRLFEDIRGGIVYFSDGGMLAELSRVYRALKSALPIKSESVRETAEKLRIVERSAVLARARADATENAEPGDEIPRIVDETPDGWERVQSGRVHNFGIFWPGERGMCVATYGPEVHFPDGWKGKAEMKGSGRFDLYAN